MWILWRYGCGSRRVSSCEWFVIRSIKSDTPWKFYECTLRIYDLGKLFSFQPFRDLIFGEVFFMIRRCNTPFLLEHGFTFVSNDFIEKLPTKLYVRRRMTQRETNFYVQLLCAVCTWSGVYVYRTQRSPLLRHALLVFFGGCDIIWSSWNIQVFPGFGVSARKVTNISKQHSLVAA